VNAQDIFQDGINHSLNKLGETISSALPGAGDTEITIHSQDNYDLRYSILAVRPLAMNPYSELSNKHLYFTQLRLANYEPYANGDQRVLFNAGLGFRTLAQNNNAVLGINIFYDHEFEQTHQRASLGLEYLTSAFEVYANKYQRLGDTSMYGTTTETVLNGYDINIVGQLPYMPWGKVIYNNYFWAGTSTDTKGERYSLEAQVLRNMIFEIGQSDPDVGSTEDFWKLTLKWPANEFKQTIVTHTVTDHMFPEKNMSGQMLHKVRRTNKIVTEKTTNPGGVVIVRGS
jgi:hypothetical protein